jgi:hypothetical protein
MRLSIERSSGVQGVQEFKEFKDRSQNPGVRRCGTSDAA